MKSSNGIPLRLLHGRRGAAGASASPRTFGQEGRDEDGAGGAEQRLFQDALQLADVARPGVGAQPRQRLRSDLAHLAAQLAVEAAQVLLDQHGQIVAPFAQRRQSDREDAEPVEQVGTELALAGPAFQVAVGGRDQPHVGPDRFAAADALEGLVLQHAQQLGLHRQRHVADLVEEQRAAAALLELADPAAVGAGEGALLVAEQLAFQQVLGDGGAVDGVKRRPAPALCW